MKFSKVGLIIASVYIVACIAYVWSDFAGGGEGWTLLFVGMPWTILVALSGINEIAIGNDFLYEIFFWILFSLPVLVNAAILYGIAAWVKKF